MRRWIPTLVLGLLVCVLGIYTMRAANAGNYQNAGALYYSVSLTAGQYFYSTDSNKIILVDDITYCVPSYRPCNPDEACDFFTDDCLGPLAWVDNPGGFPMPATGSSGLHVWSRRWASVAQVDSFATGFDISISDADGESASMEFDQHNISSYGQCALAHSQYETGFQFWALVDNPPVENSHGGVGGGGLGAAEPLAFAMYQDTEITSASRHYQTPHVVQNGRVYVASTLGGGNTAIVKVKGRTVSTSDSNKPVVDTTITVVQP